MLNKRKIDVFFNNVVNSLYILLWESLMVIYCVNVICDLVDSLGVLVLDFGVFSLEFDLEEGLDLLVLLFFLDVDIIYYYLYYEYLVGFFLLVNF